jgi:T5SS/PEP-CTERM-associated repeat protein
MSNDHESRGTSFTIAGAVCLAALIGSPVQASTDHWKFAEDGNWSDSLNWYDPNDPDATPEVPDAGIFDVSSGNTGYIVTVDHTPVTITDALVENGVVNLYAPNPVVMNVSSGDPDGKHNVITRLVGDKFSGFILNAQAVDTALTALILQAGVYDYSAISISTTGGIANINLEPGSELNTSTFAPSGASNEISIVPGGAAAVNLDDAVWNSGVVTNLRVGDINLNNDSVFNSNGLNISADGTATTTSTVSVDASELTDYSIINVGFMGGNGVLNVTGGAQVNASQVSVAAINIFPLVTSGEINVSGAESALTVSGPLSVGTQGTGTLRMDGGATLTADSLVAGNIGANPAILLNEPAHGIIDITGDNTLLDVADTLTVGGAGNAEMTASAGADVKSRLVVVGNDEEAIGTLTLTGPGTTLTTTLDESIAAGIIVGGLGNASGELNVLNGAQISTRGLDFAVNENTEGTGTVDGIGSKISLTERLIVADRGAGGLEIRNGGVVNARAVNIGNDGPAANGGIVVNGAGSELNALTTIEVGIAPGSSAALFTENGALTTAQTIAVAGPTGSKGTAVVTGAGSRWEAGLVAVGLKGDGLLVVKDGGEVVADSVYVGPTGTISGVDVFIELTGPAPAAFSAQANSAAIPQSLVPGPSAEAAGTVSGKISTPELVIDHGAVFENATLSIGAGGTFGGDGDFTGTLINGGTLSPGTDDPLVATLISTGSYEQLAAGQLLLDIGGVADDEFDVVDIFGSADLGGTLDIRLADLGAGIFSPALGDSFSIFHADSINGAFDALVGDVLPGGLAWQIDYLSDTDGRGLVQLTTVSGVPLPAAFWLMASGLGGLLGAAKRKR